MSYVIIRPFLWVQIYEGSNLNLALTCKKIYTSSSWAMLVLKKIKLIAQTLRSSIKNWLNIKWMIYIKYIGSIENYLHFPIILSSSQLSSEINIKTGPFVVTCSKIC